MKNIYNYTLEELQDYFIKNNDKKFRANQIYEFLYKKRVKTFKEMNNIGQKAIEKLEKEFSIDQIKLILKQEDKDVKKYLFELSDNNYIESVVMYHDYGTSICISSQIGCNMGCAFCESGRVKKLRNLTVDEMLLQVIEVQNDIKERISHIVIMGIGEPFDNYETVIDFIKIVNDDYALSIGSRHITVSTSGIVPKIYEFMKDCPQVNLAISLHAPNNEIRNKIMKINKVYNIEQIMKAVKDYIKETNRKVTFEYIMLDKINDMEECAYELAKLIKGLNAYVNLIPYNETNNIGFKRSNTSQISKFYDILKKENINVTIRREFGSKVSAACGQLRSEGR